jgi:D-alanine-D-alanine ligase
MTFDLREEYLAQGYGEEETAEFDQPETINALEQTLRALGHETVRIGSIRRLVECLARGERWDLVFNVCEGLHGIGREAQVPALLDAYAIPYTFSDPVCMGLCMHKGVSKTLVAHAGLPTAPFAVIHNTTELGREALQFPVFVKPVAEGTGKGVSDRSRVETPRDLALRCQELLTQFRQPVLVETYLPGREFTVGLLGSGEAATVLGTLEIVLLEGAEAHAYSYVNKEKCEQLVEYRWVDPSRDAEVAAAERTALAAWRVLGCRDAGRIDLRSDGSAVPHFLEANPLAGLHPSHSDLPILATKVGLPYRELIDRIVVSAGRAR